jgi:hypothetical protein
MIFRRRNGNIRNEYNLAKGLFSPFIFGFLIAENRG